MADTPDLPPLPADLTIFAGTFREKIRAYAREAVRLALAARESDPAVIVSVRRWYMRDNHTFAELPADDDAALARLREVFDGDCGHYGMLCATLRRADGKEGHPRPEGLHAKADWAEFEERAREWLARTPARVAPTPPDEASDALDAARYRKLRDAGRCDSKHGTGLSVGDRLTARVAFRYWCAPEELDTAIDAMPDVPHNQGDAS